ncbi:hypothetical protein [Paenibacillus lemnae]|uniref:Uncharacterized protein n=1 Tax=Paenibacillus lemnae TaxID=1330551 RepID=A0A848M0X5_PAELE|nr:hypothetical protein [Paenibacillus lemnae]NMO94578.1 hypothetical protein [Paenibacillus lemnae]
MSMRRLTPPPPSDEDEQLITSHVVFMIIQHILKRNMEILPPLSLHMSRLYLLDLAGIEKETRDQLWTVRQHLRVHGIRILKQERVPEGILISFQCRGYHRHQTVNWEEVRRGLLCSIRETHAAPSLSLKF